MSSSIKGVALVTGAGNRRVGNTVARMLAERGYDIALHYHTSRDSARQSVTEFRALAVQAKAFQANVASESEVDRLFAEVHRRFGRLDVLVTAASLFRSKSLELTTADDICGNFEVDVLGTFLCCRRAGLMMAEQPQGGLIVTIADWAVLRPYRDYAAYLIAKGTIPTMTRMLAVELARRNRAVRVNCIMPGPVMIPADLPDRGASGVHCRDARSSGRPAGKRRQGSALVYRQRFCHGGLARRGWRLAARRRQSRTGLAILTQSAELILSIGCLAEVRRESNCLPVKKKHQFPDFWTLVMPLGRAG